LDKSHAIFNGGIRTVSGGAAYGNGITGGTPTALSGVLAVEQTSPLRKKIGSKKCLLK
jgi:hypothetical protein